MAGIFEKITCTLRKVRQNCQPGWRREELLCCCAEWTLNYSHTYVIFTVSVHWNLPFSCQSWCQFKQEFTRVPVARQFATSYYSQPYSVSNEAIRDSSLLQHWLHATRNLCQYAERWVPHTALMRVCECMSELWSELYMSEWVHCMNNLWSGRILKC